ncbi:MAG: ABC transporter permease [Actinomycetales bacterium]
MSAMDVRPTSIESPLPEAAQVHRRSGLQRTLNMVRFELGLLVRQRTSLLAVLVVPIAILGYPLIIKPQTPDMWRALMAPMTVLVMVFSVYYTAASIVATRRQLQVFKRLRTSELTPVQMLTALTLPLVLVGVVQALIVVGGMVVLGAPAPRSIALLALAVITTAILSVTCGLAVGALAPSSERVQYTAMPLLMLTAILANLLVGLGAHGWHSYLLFAPFMGAVDLVARGSGLSEQLLVATPLPVSPVVFDVVMMIFWAVVAAFVTTVSWRWEPRN